MAVTMNPRRGWRALLAPSIIATILFFGVLWRLDFPKPESDDLFYLGASLNLADGGDFSNPLIARQEFPSHFFFVYPPLHSYALAGWLKVFRTNSAAMTGYTIFSCAVIAVATILILRRHGAPRWLEWLVPLGVGYGLLPLGLRAEPFAVALIMAGFALADSELILHNPWKLAVGFFLLFMGGSAAPRVTLFAGALVLLAAWHAWTSASDTRQRRIILASFFATLALTGLIFLCLIGFRLSEFLHTFNYFAAGRVFKGKLRLLHDYAFTGYFQLSFFTLALALLFCALIKPVTHLSRMAYFVAATLPLSVITGTIGSGTAWWVFLILVFSAGSFLKNLSQMRAIALQIVIALVLLSLNRKLFVESYGIVSGHIKSDRGAEAATALKLQSTAEHPLLLDGWVARYVYDYKLPMGSLDIASATKFPGMSPGSYPLPASAGPQIRPGDIYLVGNVMLINLLWYTHLERPAPACWYTFGRKQFAFFEYPRWVYLIPAGECKSIRTDNSLPLPANVQ